MEIVGTESVIAPHEGLIESFEPSPLPPAAPDGGPMLEPAPIFLPMATESICDRGPCRHRHVLLLDMDVARPMDGSLTERPRLDEHGDPIVKGQQDDGTPIYETEAWSPRQQERVCYPAAGIKIELGADEPVHECDRWDPEDPEDPDVVARERRRAAYAAREQAAAAALATAAEDEDGADADLPDDAAPAKPRRRK